jgi:hypothetical protein
MKSGWANGLRGIVALALLGGVATTPAQTPQSSSSSAEPAEQPTVVATRVVAEDGRVLSEPVKGINVEIGKPRAESGWILLLAKIFFLTRC